MPTTEQAIQQMERGISEALQDGVAIVRVVHGYGSHGIGGRIREACAASLRGLVKRGTIREFTNGQDYSPGRLVTRDLQQRFPLLKSSQQRDLDNPGITFVVL